MRPGWTPITYTIAFAANGGQGQMDAVTAAYDQELTLPKSTFTYAGYSFLGWGKYNSSSSASYADGETVKNLADRQDETVTLYARVARPAGEGDPAPEL